MWLSWQSGRLQHQRSKVRIQSSANFYRTFVYCKLCWKDENKEKRGRVWPIFNHQSALPLRLIVCWAATQFDIIRTKFIRWHKHMFRFYRHVYSQCNHICTKIYPLGQNFKVLGKFLKLYLVFGKKFGKRVILWAQFSTL